MKGITDRQLMVLAFIGGFIRRESKAPTLKEMCAGLDWNSTHSAHLHVRALEKKGFIETGSGSKSRDLKLTGSGWLKLGYSRCDHCGSLVEPGKKVA